MSRPSPPDSNAGAPPAPSITHERRQALALALPLNIEMLRQRRTADVPYVDVEAYVALGWMRWAGGRIVVTPAGMSMRDIVVASEERHERP